MRWLVSVLALLFAALVSAKSAAGDRLLVVLDDVAEKDAYTTFLEDVKGMSAIDVSARLLFERTVLTDTARGMSITYETPKSEDLALFKHGERSYDHVLFLPSKVKGEFQPSPLQSKSKN